MLLLLLLECSLPQLLKNAILDGSSMQAVTHHSAPCMILGEDGIATVDVISNIEPKVEK